MSQAKMVEEYLDRCNGLGSIDLTEEQFNRLRAMADARGVTLREMLELAIHALLDSEFTNMRKKIAQDLADNLNIIF